MMGRQNKRLKQIIGIAEDGKKRRVEKKIAEEEHQIAKEAERAEKEASQRRIAELQAIVNQLNDELATIREQVGFKQFSNLSLLVQPPRRRTTIFSRQGAWHAQYRYGISI